MASVDQLLVKQKVEAIEGMYIYIFIGTSGQNWTTVPQGEFSCPKGLEYLASVDQLLVKQKVEVLEGKINFNEIIIKDYFSHPVSTKKYNLKSSLL